MLRVFTICPLYIECLVGFLKWPIFYLGVTPVSYFENTKPNLHQFLFRCSFDFVFSKHETLLSVRFRVFKIRNSIDAIFLKVTFIFRVFKAWNLIDTKFHIFKIRNLTDTEFCVLNTKFHGNYFVKEAFVFCVLKSRS